MRLLLAFVVEFIIAQAGEFLNLRINHDPTTQIQNEEQIMANPIAESNLVAVWRDFRLGYRQVGFGCSFDAGRTWQDGLLAETTYAWQSDPGLTVDADGNFYAVVLSLNSTSESDGIFVLKSSDGGMTWGESVPVVSGIPSVFEDKELIACDRTDSPYQGNLYVCWTRFTPITSEILFSRSNGKGNQFFEPVTISDQGIVQWPVPAVGPEGEVYVAWVSYGPSCIVIDRSFDGGRSFGSDVVVAPVEVGDLELNGGIWTFSFPALAVDVSSSPFRGSLYIAFMDFINDGDIYFVKSTDHGSTWSKPKRLNDDPVDNCCDQFHPWLAVDENGIINVVFYDRRNDPNNLLFDVYLTRSFDGGETFTPNVRVSDVSSAPIGFRGDLEHRYPAGLLGEYIGVTSAAGKPVVIWTDTREGDQNVYVGVDTTTTGSTETAAPPLAFSLSPPIPDPFNRYTALSYHLPAEKEIYLAVYDVFGNRVKTLAQGVKPAGDNKILWDGRDERLQPLPAGVYFGRLVAATRTVSQKMILLR